MYLWLVDYQIQQQFNNKLTMLTLYIIIKIFKLYYNNKYKNYTYKIIVSNFSLKKIGFIYMYTYINV